MDNAEKLTTYGTQVITNGQCRETDNIWYTGGRQTKQKHNTIQYVLDTTIPKQTQIT